MANVKPLFNVALTADFYDAKGQPKYRDMGLSVLDEAKGIQYAPFKEHRPVIGADQVGAAHGVIVLTPAVKTESVAGCKDLLAIGRFGVGYDAVDVKACTESDVAVFITTGAVDRSVAEATVTWMLTLTHQVRKKDQLVRTGQWDERSKFMGAELRDRTLGVVGLGGIGKALVRLLDGFGMKQPLVFDPFLADDAAAKLGVKKVSLEDLLRQSDFVSIHCPLTDQTRGLIGAKQIGMMRKDAYLINTARGGIVVEDALFDALRNGRIAGAALDCFEVEPVTQPHRFGELDNVILAPHSIAWTNELFRDIGRTVCQGMVDLSEGRRPKGVVNPQVFDRPGFTAKWQRIGGGA